MITRRVNRSRLPSQVSSYAPITYAEVDARGLFGEFQITWFMAYRHLLRHWPSAAWFRHMGSRCYRFTLVGGCANTATDINSHHWPDRLRRDHSHRHSEFPCGGA